MSFNSFEFAGEVCTSLLGNVKTLTVGNQSLSIWTDSTSALTTNWQQGNKDSFVAKAIKEVQDGKMSLQDFIDKYMNQDYLNQFSVADTQKLLDVLTKNWPDKTGTALMGEIQTFGQLVSAQQQLETSTGDTESKAMGSYLQQLTSAQQPIADMGNSAIGILSTAGSILMQSFL
ncbi:MAG: hypothetical protein COT85_08030 [Chlamydiae bacterium CG10_big_fil_rev_8_21_14_0_10_42_34]|nr:MAG: hypothetical protein COT85_08030 [Chlamydiae bacterium CG10_big_fil_rev_8_21_14_0_10_42_34]